MRESPFFDEIAADTRRLDISQVLEIRFGPEAAEELRPALKDISDLDRLLELLTLAIRCRRIADFRRALALKTGVR